MTLPNHSSLSLPSSRDFRIFQQISKVNVNIKPTAATVAVAVLIGNGFFKVLSSKSDKGLFFLCNKLI